MVGIGWAWAILTVAFFMVRMLNIDPADPDPPKASEFTANTGPWIIAATVALPALVATWFNWLQKQGTRVLTEAEPARSALARAADHSYAALILPSRTLSRAFGGA